MKTIAAVLLAVAIAVIVIQGFSWIWMAAAVFSAGTLVFNGLRTGLQNTFKSG